uniref:carbamoyltransferase HypF n=1 Tax=Saccharomonospora saliphila TaxID=369829 RepID=UPI000369E6EB
TAELLRAGHVVAVKGLGGYHLAADATSEAATAALRSRKHRVDKPFAVMVPTPEHARALCQVDAVADELLGDRRAPIVLLDRRDPESDPIAPSVAPGTRELGLMLPYTGLHHLLLAETGTPLVLTSGNVADEPIAFRDDDALARLSGIADALLTHDRPIHTRVDDSVVRPWRGGALPVRRSRGYAPAPITCAWEFPRPVLACGAELKNTVCLARDRRAVCSHHIGDLEDAGTLAAFTEAIAHLGRLFDTTPDVVAHDLHPEYLSTKYALDRDDVETVGVQHHHAHIAACLADNGVDGPVIGVAFDGTGYGTDGTIWGGEFLLATLAGFERVGHFGPVPMPGGTAAVRQPWRMAAAYLRDVADADLGELPVVRRDERRWGQVRALARSGVHAPPTSSAGRLFDAVAAVLDLREVVTYEGQAAIELEQRAERSHPGSYPVPVSEELIVDVTALVRAVVDDRLRGTDPGVIAARFHNSLVSVVTRVCAAVSDRTGVRRVALSGGVFGNRLLADRTVAALERAGMMVLTHTRVPCNDGGISLGQAAVVGARDRAAG